MPSTASRTTLCFTSFSMTPGLERNETPITCLNQHEEKTEYVPSTDASGNSNNHHSSSDGCTSQWHDQCHDQRRSDVQFRHQLHAGLRPHERLSLPKRGW